MGNCLEEACKINRKNRIIPQNSLKDFIEQLGTDGIQDNRGWKSNNVKSYSRITSDPYDGLNRIYFTLAQKGRIFNRFLMYEFLNSIQILI